MVISHKHKFVHIAISKAGTASILDAFEHLNANKRGHVDYNRKQSCSLHGSITEFYDKVPQGEDYFKFCFTRNPYSRIVSVYFQYRKRQGLKSARRKELYELSNKLSFSEFIKTVDWNERSMMEYITHDDNIHVDYIGKQENLSEDFTTLVDKHLKIKNIKLPMKNTSDEKKKHYTEYYDNTSRDIISDRYAEDLKYFKYNYGE